MTDLPRYNRILEPGVNVLVPIVDKVKYVQSLKEIAIDIPQQSAITVGSNENISTYMIWRAYTRPIFR